MRWSLAALGAAVGFYVALSWLGQLSQSYPPALTATQATGLVVAGILVGAAFGFRVGLSLLRLLRSAVRTAEQHLARMPGVDVLAGVLGIIAGLIIAYLLSPAMSHLPWIGRAAVTLLLAYVGWTVFVHKREDWLRLWPGVRGAAAVDAPPPPSGAAAEAPRLTDGRPKVFDTSAIIDGRIADLYRTGFLEGQLVVPTYVLDELRHLADSPDDGKRQRGRHGLAVLGTLQRELHAPVGFEAPDPDPEMEVDMKLVRLARELGGQVVTTDFNLNKVAELQGVAVLNVNDLANAVRPRYLYGEEMVVRIVGAGKQPGQGVGYLEDGTMVLVEGARRHIGEDVEITVTNFIQNDKGRMIFGKLRVGRLVPS